MKLYETELNEAVLEKLIALSKAWAAEKSCFGYRANERADVEGNRIFLAEENGAEISRRKDGEAMRRRNNADRVFD